MKVSENDRLDIVRMKERVPRGMAEKLTRLADKEAILDVLMQYGHLCDALDWDGVLSLCTDDVERVLGGTLEEVVKGKDALRDRYKRPSLKRASDGATVPSLAADRVYHLIATPVVRIADNGKEAWSAQYYSVVSIVDKPENFGRGIHEGTSIFTYVKQRGKWKIKRMVLITDLAHDPIWAKHYRK